MKIRKVTPENYGKALALLGQAFPGRTGEVQLVENLHAHDRELLEWVCIHINKVIAYIAFSRAYKGRDVCGWHLAPLAVHPDLQKQGIGSELLRFALRQNELKKSTIFVLGDPGFYKRFGFAPCAQPTCPFTEDSTHFLSLGHKDLDPFVVGYEPEFQVVTGQPVPRRSGAH